MEHRIVTWNVNGLRARADSTARIWELLRPTVLFLQETKCDETQVPAAVRKLPGVRQFYNPGPKGYAGTAALVRADAFAGVDLRFETPPFDAEGRAVALRWGADRVLVGLYMPNGGKDYRAKLDFYDALIDWTEAELEAGHHVWLCGDMNVAHTDRDIHPSQRRRADIGVRPAERDRVDELLSCGLTDLYRETHPDVDDHFTWWPYWRGLRARNHGWRIDYHLASPGFGEVRRLSIHTDDTGSDHAPVIADVVVPAG